MLCFERSWGFCGAELKTTSFMKAEAFMFANRGFALSSTLCSVGGLG